MSQYIATYDISDDGRRQRVARLLLNYGVRIQWSVFEIDLEPNEVDELRWQVGPMLGKFDAFEVIPIDNTGNRSRWRWQKPFRVVEPVIVIG